MYGSILLLTWKSVTNSLFSLWTVLCFYLSIIVASLMWQGRNFLRITVAHPGAWLIFFLEIFIIKSINYFLIKSLFYFNTIICGRLRLFLFLLVNDVSGAKLLTSSRLPPVQKLPLSWLILVCKVYVDCGDILDSHYYTAVPTGFQLRRYLFATMPLLE